MSTVNQDGTAHVNTAFFCADSKWRMFFVSSENARHSRNIKERSSDGGRSVRLRSSWDDWKTGLQLFGTCAVARGRDAGVGASCTRRDSRRTRVGCMGSAEQIWAQQRAPFFIFVPESLKVLHEEVLAKRRS